MLLHYLKIAWRNIWNDKFYSAINLMGLTVAFTVVFLFVQWIRHELTYENDHVNAKRIYRVEEAEKRADGIHKSFFIRPGVTDEIKAKYPIVEEVTALNHERISRVVENEPMMFWMAKGTMNFFKVFPMECVAGTLANIESNKGGLFINEETAKKFYGNSENAVGKKFQVNYNESKLIEGVIRVPSHSIIGFEVLMLSEHVIKNYGGVHYMLLKDNVQLTVEQQYTMGQFFSEMGSENKLVFTPLKDIYLNSGGNSKEISTMFWVVMLLMILAIINYINTSTARAMSRAREVGVRKISGSNRKQLVTRFLTEAFIISVIAVFLAFDIAKLLHHPFENMIGNTFSFSLNLETLSIGLIICVITTILSGGYAAFYLSSLNPVTVLAGGTTKSGSKNAMRKILLGFQFAIAIGVLICTWTVYRQLQYMLNKDIGFNKENVYIFDTSLMYESEDFIRELLKNTAIENASMAMGAPYNIGWGYSGVTWSSAKPGTEEVSFGEIACDHRFDETFGLEVLQGNFLQPTGSFNPMEKSDEYNNIVINETFKKLIGVDNPVGMTITYGGRWQKSGKIMGVVKDFHFQPMNIERKPLIMRYDPEMCFAMFIKINPDREKEALAHIRATYDKMRDNIALLSKRPFNLSPMKEDYKNVYKSVSRLQGLLFVFSLLSIVLSFMGIVSMVAFIIEKRTKEIGIQ